jgi:hypothetical protein
MFDKKIVEDFCEVKNYEVLSDVGFIPIKYVLKTKKFKKFVILFESGKILECADKHILIDIDYKCVYCKDIKSGDRIICKDGLDVVFDIFEYEEETMYDLSLEHHHLFYTNDILSHNSNFMVNMAARQMMKGHNVVYLSLEMAEDELAKRVDAQLTKLDINRIYDSKKKEFLTNLKSVKTGGEGRLLFKQFPTGTASVNDFRSYLYELQMRDIRIDCIYVDYLNIMRPTASSGDGNLYTDVKKIGEELRAMSYIFKCPIVTATQTTRQGVISEIGEISFAMLSESIGTAATADFIMVLGSDSDSLVYQNEIFYKILKNRLGGRVGEIDKMYVDNRSLKMYDSVELDQWISDATISGANTQMAN